MRVAILVTEYLSNFIKTNISNENLNFDIELYTYSDYSEIAELYKNLEEKFDGFLLTGPGPTQIIKNTFKFHKPLEFFLCSETNYYKTFLEIVYKYNDLNFEYGYFDFCDYLCPDQEASLITYLKEGNFKEWLDRNNDFISKLSFEQIEFYSNEKLKKHLKLWKDGKIKYSISRMSHLMPILQKEGVECHYISFSEEDIKLAFEKLSCKILQEKITNSKIGSIKIQPLVIDDEIQEKLAKIKEMLSKFMKKNLCDFSVTKNLEDITLITNNETIKNITNYFKNCSLRIFLKERLNFEFYIAYGIGDNIIKANYHSELALKELKSSYKKGSFLVDERENFIPLLEKKNSLLIKRDFSPYIKELVEKTGLSTLTLQKFITALRITGTEEITTQDLVQVLHIELRNVNRIVSALLKAELAEIMYTKQINPKGRPSKVYKFFIEI